MTRQTFTEQFSGELKAYLETKSGTNFLIALQAMRIPYEFPKEEHLLAENRGAMRGYDTCLRNIIALCTPPKMEAPVEANYGVPQVLKEENPKP